MTTKDMAPDEFAATYFALSDMLAQLGPHSTQQDADRVVEAFGWFFTDDPVVASERVWQAAFVGPVLVAAAILKLHEQCDGAFWALHQPDDYDPVRDPHLLPAMQAVTANLNGDPDGAADIVAAHFKSALSAWGDQNEAHEALFEVVTHHMRMLADLIHAGVLEL